MSTVSGACSVNKVSGMVNIREDVTPSILEWRAIDQQKTITIPLPSLQNLKASKEGSPNMMLQIIYKGSDGSQKKLTFSFTNRPTMNNIKETLQTVVVRSRTVIKDSPTPNELSSGQTTPGASSGATESSPAPGSSGMKFNSTNLTDQGLLKNHQLQQKLLLEDKQLRNIFTQSVIKYKMSPTVFWSTRLHLLRTFALTISQHRGPYNVLSTIRPVASSDNQVNVNVTRDSINAIFETYPVVRRAFKDLVPSKFSEGEFWSRFFNSKLFRRLRGDKINTPNERGDYVLDKYLYIDSEYLESDEPENAPIVKKAKVEENMHVSKFLDLKGNEVDNSQKMGNMPDITMRFSDDFSGDQALTSSSKGKAGQKGQENEMIILMKHMNNLSSKMVSMSVGSEDINDDKTDKDNLSLEEMNEFQEELDLHDLNETAYPEYIKLNINSDMGNRISHYEHKDLATISSNDLSKFLSDNVFTPEPNGIDLSDIYTTRKDEIDKTANDITAMIKTNFRSFKLLNNLSMHDQNAKPIISDEIISEIYTFSSIAMEFLSQFWKLFLNGNNPVQLKKLFTALKNCKTNFTQLTDKLKDLVANNESIIENPKAKEKVLSDVVNSLSPLQIGLDKACSEYVSAVKKSMNSSTNTDNDNDNKNSSINSNNKRPLE
ncbi:Piso0_004439 [Millerozyma farinosa CBS 7064]|uniref:Piso0_004439 protein n=1 Tax=Pichia sorbitophila (strain ATCC MYA-4447 / BCRC 22081 / CBS 7064 / NBRC 10061 / NRRL Y-12695) TaxID=559304 RepID=G8Y8T5_PICSO|nr:Piso0_004439 [Millerozyma farinosa CBS 7064]CCE84880.1 Piso0_004439 [Millerozyma farinosa CBS 7064]